MKSKPSTLGNIIGVVVFLFLLCILLSYCSMFNIGYNYGFEEGMKYTSNIKYFDKQVTNNETED